MQSLRSSIVALMLVVAASAAGAQQPTPAPNGPPGGRGEMRGGARMRMPGQPGMRRQGPGGGIASMFLAHTGELKLSDQQVTRLASIARRTEERHTAMRASMDSAMRANRPQGGQPGERALAPSSRDMEQMRATMERARQSERADVRDALAVLTPDQLTDAWMLRGGGDGPRGGPRVGAMRMRQPAPRQ